MLSEPGFWVMIAGAIICAYGFLGLAFSRIGKEMPVNNADKRPKQEQHAGETEVTALPNPFSTGRRLQREHKAVAIAL
ncbi:MAG: hypothetical protein ACXVKH_17220 [Candidatus Angelobacter sp.]